ncbi:glycosyltransferase family 2 protein [Conexibacter sp. DBS9H8]|uniref:glycosyltransferase family 2 protein n=1 Tax=Conexibacter sp. DBS9H8 TaxID=2937801 RepID=UPI0020105F50|nr:glycosyltransferase family 2 protein [Conexibacter sp. DBS9H8]
MTLTVAIASFNGRHLLEATLPSYAAQVLPPDRLIVVDDGSTDGTVTWLNANWPQVEVIVHEHNRGITAALNTCLQAGLSSDYVGLFNNDVELAPKALTILCAALERNPSVAAVGPKMLNYYDRTLIDGAGDEYSWAGTAARRGQGARDVGQYDRSEPIFGVCGGAAVYRTRDLRTVGIFDGDLSAYFEDVDWALRAQLRGCTCLYEPAAVVFHMNSATAGAGANPFSSYHVWRNQIWLVARHWSTREIVTHSHLLLFGQVLNLGIAVRRGLLSTLLRAWRDGLRGVPQRRRMRRQDPLPVRPLDLPAVVGFVPPGWRALSGRQRGTARRVQRAG